MNSVCPLFVEICSDSSQRKVSGSLANSGGAFHGLTTFFLSIKNFDFKLSGNSNPGSPCSLESVPTPFQGLRGLQQLEDDLANGTISDAFRFGDTLQSEYSQGHAYHLSDSNKIVIDTPVTTLLLSDGEHRKGEPLTGGTVKGSLLTLSAKDQKGATIMLHHNEGVLQAAQASKNGDHSQADPEIGALLSEFVGPSRDCSFSITKLGFLLALVAAAYFIGSEIGKFTP